MLRLEVEEIDGLLVVEAHRSRRRLLGLVVLAVFLVLYSTLYTIGLRDFAVLGIYTGSKLAWEVVAVVDGWLVALWLIGMILYRERLHVSRTLLMRERLLLGRRFSAKTWPIVTDSRFVSRKVPGFWSMKFTPHHLITLDEQVLPLLGGSTPDQASDLVRQMNLFVQRAT